MGSRSSLVREPHLPPDKVAILKLDFIAVKGKKEPEVVYAIVGRDDMINSGRFQRWRELNMKMLSCYRSRDWTATLDIIEQGRAADEEQRFTTLYKVYAERVRAFADQAASRRLGWRIRSGVQVAECPRRKSDDSSADIPLSCCNIYFSDL